MAEDVRISQGLREVLQADTAAETRHAMVIPSVAVREVLQADEGPPTVDKTLDAAISSLAKEVLQRDAPAQDLALMAAPSQLYREVLYRMPDFGVSQAFREVLLTYTALPGTTAYTHQHLSTATMALPVSPIAQVISTEKVPFVSTLAIQRGDVMSFPWSNSRTGQEVMLVAQARLGAVQSVTRTPQAMTEILQQAATGAYRQLQEVYSQSRVGQSVILVLQSRDIAYTPDSNEYVPQIRVMSVQGSDLTTLWASPASVKAAGLKVAVSLGPSTLPRSYIFTRQVVTQAVTSASKAMPRSVTRVNQSISQAVVATSIPLPVGRIWGRQVRTQTVQARTDEWPQGVDHAAQSRVAVAQAASYPTVDSQLARARASRVAVDVLMGSDYALPDNVQSFSRYAQAATIYTQRADPAWYPPVSGIETGSKYSFLRQFTELVAQDLTDTPWPISRLRVPQFTEQVTLRADYRPASSVATSGITMSQVAQIVAVTDVYDDAHNAYSFLEVWQLCGQVAQVDVYESAHIIETETLVSQITETCIQTDTYPDPAALKSDNIASQIAAHLALEDSYPSPSGVHSLQEIRQIAEQVAVGDVFPDKDQPQSRLVVRQVAEQVAETCSYPDKDIPQSRIMARQIREQIALTDPDMYVMPRPLRRQRVKIIGRVVYE